MERLIKAKKFLALTYSESEIEDILENGEDAHFQHTVWHKIVVDGNLYSFELQTGGYDESKQPFNGDILIDDGENQFTTSVNGKDQEDWLTIINGVTEAIKMNIEERAYSLYAISNDGSTENIESSLSLPQAIIKREKLNQQIKDGVFINTTTSLSVVTEVDFDKL